MFVLPVRQRPQRGLSHLSTRSRLYVDSLESFGYWQSTAPVNFFIFLASS